MTIFQSLIHRVGAGSAIVDSLGFFFSPTDFEEAIEFLRRHSEIVWFLPFLATAGSMIVAGIAFWIGRRFGTNGLGYWISPGLLEIARQEVGHRGAAALVLPALLPPPFPVLPFVLACGALSVSATRFFIMLASLRLMRFSILTALVWFYGQQVLNMLDTGTFRIVIAGIMIVMVAGISATVYRLARRVHQRHRTSLLPREATPPIH
jgi:membrane protein DedA with SNARE-associated domain